MKIKKIKDFYYAFKQLQKIEKKLHRLNEINANQGLTKKQEKRQAKLEKEANEIAKKTFGCYAFYQQDPRGVALYLIEKKKDGKAGLYNKGLPIL